MDYESKEYTISSLRKYILLRILSPATLRCIYFEYKETEIDVRNRAVR